MKLAKALTVIVALLFFPAFGTMTVFAEETELMAVNSEEQVSDNTTLVENVEGLKNAIEQGKFIKLSTTIDDISDNIYICDGKNIELDLANNSINFVKGKGFIIKGATFNIVGEGIISEVEDGKGDYSPIQLFGDENHTIVTIGENVTLKGWAGVMLRNSGKWSGDGIAADGNMTLILMEKS